MYCVHCRLDRCSSGLEDDDTWLAVVVNNRLAVARLSHAMQSIFDVVCNWRRREQSRIQRGSICKYRISCLLLMVEWLLTLQMPIRTFEMTHISTAPQGTPGYLDPDYQQSYQLSDKSDVYSFGVVLMELITAKKAVDMARNRREINLAAFAVAKIQAGTLDEIIDPYLKRNFDIESGTHDTKTRDMVNSVAELAFRCLAAEKDDRPCMKEVLEELRRIREHGYGSDPPNLANHDASSDTRLFGSLKEGEYIELDISYGSVYNNNNNKDTKPLITTEREQQNSAAPWRHSLTSEDDVWESVHSSPDHNSVTQIWHEINLVSCHHRCYTALRSSSSD